MRPRFVYHLFPLGLCGALDGPHGPHPGSLRDLGPWLEHLCSLGCDTLFLGPVFQASSHGYDTIDPHHVDPRIGTDDDLRALVDAAHARGVSVVIDAVFNHLGRESPQFRALRDEGGHGRFHRWFKGIRHDRRSPLGDPFDYDTWAGHHSLPRLDTDCAEVREWWADVVRGWYRRFAIDGLRLDAADCLSPDFLRFIASVARAERPGTWLMGEVVHGDYRERMGEGLLDSITNYELYKGTWSGVENRCLHETAHSLDRQSGAAGIYRDRALYTFLDNHDVARLASNLTRPESLYPAWGLLLTMPGVPSVYYGSEFGLPGPKARGSDSPLRPALDLASLGSDATRRSAAAGDLVHAIRRLAAIRLSTPALDAGRYEELFVSDTTLAFRRFDERGSECVVVVNAAAEPARVRPGRGLKRGGAPGSRSWDAEKAGQCRGLTLPEAGWTDLLDGSRHASHDGRLDLVVPGHWLRILKRDPV